MLQVFLFGGFRLSSADGSRIDIVSAKQRALMAYLAVNRDKAIERGQLASLFWGGQSEGRARHSLTQAVSALVAQLGDGATVLERSRTTIRLRPDLFDSDFARIESGAATSDPTTQVDAVDLFEPDVLSEFALAEPAFDEWALMIREMSQEYVIRAGLNYLARDQKDRDAEVSLRVVRKLIRVDPFNESLHRALIREHLGTGNTGAAAKQAQACRLILLDELGVEPAPETERLIAQIAVPRDQHAVAPLQNTSDATERPSIVVLPLRNLTSDPAFGHICEGLSDDVTTELVRYRSLFVISHESAVQVLPEPEQVGTLCRRLGVRHALAGSLRPYRGKLRINLRLIEGTSGRSVWSERYDIEPEELLDVSDDVIEQLVARLAISLDEDVLARARRRPTASWSAYDHLLQGLVYHHRAWYGTGALRGAVKHFSRAIELDPEFARAHAYLACAISAPWYEDRELQSLDRCLYHAERAVQLDPFEAEAQRIMGGVHLMRGSHDLSNYHFRQAVKSHPGNAHVLAHMARYHVHVGENDDAVSLVNRARQLNPLHPAWYWQHLGLAAFGKEDYRETLRMFSRLQAPVFYDRLYLAAACAYLGEEPAAKRHLQVALQNKPNLDGKTVIRFLPYRHDTDRATVVEGLRIAGLH